MCSRLAPQVSNEAYHFHSSPPMSVGGDSDTSSNSVEDLTEIFQKSMVIRRSNRPSQQNRVTIGSLEHLMRKYRWVRRRCGADGYLFDKKVKDEDCVDDDDKMWPVTLTVKKTGTINMVCKGHENNNKTAYDCELPVIEGVFKHPFVFLNTNTD